MYRTLQRFDTYVTARIQALPDSWRSFFRLMTLVGQPVFALIASATIAYYGEYTDSWQLIAAGMVVASALLFASSLKYVLRRKRPLTDYAAAMFFKTYSFPSGHAAASASCYGLVVYLCLASGDPIIVTTGVILIPLVLAVGISRIYLGAHFPTDVIGGWLFGGIGLSLAIWILQQ